MAIAVARPRSGCAAEPSTVLAGLVPAIHAAPSQYEFDIRLAGSEALQDQSFSVLIALRTPFKRGKHVDGRVKPGHDTSQGPKWPLHPNNSYRYKSQQFLYAEPEFVLSIILVN